MRDNTGRFVSERDVKAITEYILDMRENDNDDPTIVEALKVEFELPRRTAYTWLRKIK